MSDVLISRGTQSAYDGLEVKNPDQIYICIDSGRVYQGERLLSDNIQSDWNQSSSTAIDFIKNKPDLSQYDIEWEVI